MRIFIKEENGVAIVEATFLLPICFIAIIALYYASIFLCQKANLQANLQTTIIYYKNAETDSFITAEPAMNIAKNGNDVSSEGSRYEISHKLFPYRFFGMNLNRDDFETMFRSISGYMFFDTGENVELSVEKENYIVYKKIKATATQVVKPAISLSMVGVPDSLTISAACEVAVQDSDEFIRNTDFVIDIVSETEVGKKIGGMLDKVSEYYNRFKEIFGV